VLVVDDDDGVRRSVAALLRHAGFGVHGVASGTEALAILSSTTVGVLILDVRMPGLNGLDLLAAVPDPPPTLLVSAMTLDSAVMSHWPKATAWLPKPVPPAMMLAAVRGALVHTANRADGERSRATRPDTARGADR
jgi:DNA-binding NtrC family response regulator